MPFLLAFLIGLLSLTSVATHAQSSSSEGSSTSSATTDSTAGYKEIDPYQSLEGVLQTTTPFSVGASLKAGVEYFKFSTFKGVNNTTASDTIPLLGGEIRVKYGDFALSGLYQATDKGQDDFRSPLSDKENLFVKKRTVIDTYNDLSLERQDYGVTLAWSLPYHKHFFGLFGGYKWSETQFLSQNVINTIIYDVTVEENQKKFKVSDASITYKLDEHTFKTQGPFAGLTYTYNPFGADGLQLGASFSIGRLESEYTIHPFQNGKSEKSEAQAVDTTTAVRYSIFIGAPLVNWGNKGQIKYRIGVDHSSYSMVTPQSGNANPPEIEETVTMFNAVLEWEWASLF